MISSITDLYQSRLATAKTRATLLALLVFLLPFERIPSLDVFSVTVRASQLVGLALIFVSIGPIIAFYKSKPRLPKLLLPAFLLSYFLSALMATDLKRSTLVFVFTVFVALVGSAIAATLTIDELPRIEKYLYISTGIVLIVGFYQYFGDVFGLSPAYTGLRDIYVKEIFGFPRIQSTSLEPLYYGSFLLIPYCLLLAKRIAGSKYWRWEGLLLGVLACQIVLTVSRGAIYSAIISLGVLSLGLIVVKKATFRAIASSVGIILVGASAALVLTWATSTAVNNKNSKNNGGANTKKLVEQTANTNAQGDRLRNRTLAVEAFKEQPIFGIGPGNFNQYAVAQYPPYAKVAPVIVNNEPLELVAEAGIIGFALFVLFAAWTWALVALGYVKKNIKSKHLVYWVPATLVYTIALAVQYQTFSTLYVMHVWVAIGLLMAFGLKGE